MTALTPLLLLSLSLLTISSALPLEIPSFDAAPATPYNPYTSVAQPYQYAPQPNMAPNAPSAYPPQPYYPPSYPYAYPPPPPADPKAWQTDFIGSSTRERSKPVLAPFGPAVAPNRANLKYAIKTPVQPLPPAQNSGPIGMIPGAGDALFGVGQVDGIGEGVGEVEPEVVVPPKPVEKIDLMSAPKHKLPMPSDKELEEEEKAARERSRKAEEEEQRDQSKGKGFMDEDGDEGKDKKSKEDDKKGVAGTGWYLDDAKKEHRGTGFGDRRQGRDWAAGRRKGRAGRLGDLFGSGNPFEDQETKKKLATEEEEEEVKKAEEEMAKKAAEEEEEEKKIKEEEKKAPQVDIRPSQDGRLKYEINIGGAGTGPKYKTVTDPETGKEQIVPDEEMSNFHTWTQEGTKRLTGDSMDPECETYIRDKMLPKLGGGKRKQKNRNANGGTMFSIFGDD